MFRRIITFTMMLAVLVPGFWFQAQESTMNDSTPLAAQADVRVSRWFDASQPGAVVLLMKDGKVLFKKGYGLANVELGVAIQPDMVFRIGSVTKQFTAAAVMLLVEEGKVDLQAPISSYLEKLPKAWEAVTVEHLLNHTSGIPNYTRSHNLIGGYSFWEHARDNLTPSQLLESVSDRPLDFGDPPGTHYLYSNTGYVLLGMLIEKISGQPYARFLQKRLFEPLGLKHIRYDTKMEIIPGMVSGYTDLNPNLRPAPYMSATQEYSAGGLVSNAEDLARWTLALHAGKVVKPESLARMLTPTRVPNGQDKPYGFGLGFSESQGDRLVGHGGGVNGFTCLVEADPMAKAVAVILNNTDTPQWREEYISRFLLALAAGKPLLEHITIAVDSSKLKLLPPSILLSIPNRSPDPDAPSAGWAAESCIQMGMAYYKKEMSQRVIFAAGKSAHSNLSSNEIDTAMEALGVKYSSWDWRNRDVAQFLAWLKTNLAKGYPVLCGIKMYPSQHSEWSLDHFVLVVGYNEGGLFIDTNISGDERILVTYSQLTSLINRYSFENQYHYYFGRAFLGVKDSEVIEVPAPATVKPTPQFKPIAVDSAKMKRLTGRYTAGGRARIITFDGEKIFSHKEGREIYSLIPLSETEYRFAGYEDRLRFELVGDKVIGVYHREADNTSEEPIQTRVEPIEDKNPEVTAIVQEYIREAIDGTLKPEILTDNLAAQIFPDRVKEAGAFFKSLGPQTGLDLYERELQSGGYRYLYRLSYGNKIVTLNLSLLEDKRISKVDFFLE